MAQPQQTKALVQAEPPANQQPLPEMDTIAILGATTAVCVWGLLQIIKTFFSGWREANPKAVRPWFWSGALRAASLLFGAAIGSVLYDSLGGVGSGWPWGTAIGAGSGGLATLIVWVVKAKIKKAAE